MIEGIVTQRREATIPLTLVATDGTEITMAAVVDTGFTEAIALPGACLERLGVSPSYSDPLLLADGSEITVDLYECVVLWGGERRDVLVYCVEGTPLVGMSLLWEHLFTMHATDGGSVGIEPLP